MKSGKKINMSRVSMKIDTRENKLLSQVVNRINKNTLENNERNGY